MKLSLGPLQVDISWQKGEEITSPSLADYKYDRSLEAEVDIDSYKYAWSKDLTKLYVYTPHKDCIDVYALQEQGKEDKTENTNEQLHETVNRMPTVEEFISKLKDLQL